VLKSQNIFLRELQSTDVDFILECENNSENWEVSGTTEPFSREEIVEFVDAEHDIYLNEQIRYVICINDSKRPIGTVDLFEFDEQEKSVGLGILIADKTNRQKGFASESLNLISDYCRNELNIVNLFCNIQKNNTASIRLFEKNGFQFVEETELFEKPINYYTKAL
jgi:diamine N-acetyltransferase